MEDAMSSPIKTLMSAALGICGAMAVQTTPVEAQVYYGYGRPGYFGGYYGPRYGWGHGGGYWGPRYGWGYRTASWGRPYYGYYPYGYYRSYDNGGAVVAGLIGGLALGAIANAATRPAYYRTAYPAYNNCFFERRRIVTRSGVVVVRRVRSCY
jgi:hypothetical protein